MRAKAIIAGAAIVALAGLAACGGEEKETSAVPAADRAELREQADKRDAEYEAQVQEVREEARAAEKRAVKRAERRAAKRAAAKAAADEQRAAEEAAAAEGVEVPNVVGMDHQLAQDTMQAAGFYSLLEEDCTGQDRLLLWDRNWTVQEQTPAGGSSASVDEDITLCSVKDGE